MKFLPRGYRPSYLERQKMEQNKTKQQTLPTTPTPTANMARYKQPTDLEELLAVVQSRLPYVRSILPTESFVLASPDSVPTSDNSDGRWRCSYDQNGECHIYSVNRFSDRERAAECYEQMRAQNRQPRWCFDLPPQGQVVYVSFPSSTLLRKTIDRLAQMVIVDGQALEQALVRRNLREFEFLKHNSSSENQYYRWRVYSYLMGDGETFYNQQPYAIQEGGRIYIPPKQRPPVRMLTDRERDHLAGLLNKLSRKKYDIEEPMVFAIRHHDKAVQIVLVLSVWIHQRVDKALELIYLISDILHNSLVMSYPGLFKVVLPQIMQYLSTRIQPDIRQRLLALVQIWRVKVIYQDEFLDGLKYLLETPEVDTNLEMPVHLLSKSQQQIEDQCRANGLPRDHLMLERLTHFSKLRQHIRMKQTLSREGPYDGTPLTAQQLNKIKSGIVKVVSFHPLTHLK